MPRALSALAAAALALSACASQEDIWQVVAIYTDPAVPGDLPPDAHGTANFSITDGTVRGFTPCARVTAQVNQHDEQLTITSIEMQPRTDTDCTGGKRRTHEQLSALLAPGSLFHVNVYPANAVSLVKADTDEVDAPIITLRKF